MVNAPSPAVGDSNSLVIRWAELGADEGAVGGGDGTLLRAILEPFERRRAGKGAR
jgi:hypothetical protein